MLSSWNWKRNLVVLGYIWKWNWKKCFNYYGRYCTNFSLACIYSCGDGYTANAACDGCDIANICIVDNPCQNNGTCDLKQSPDQYMCNCTNHYMRPDCLGTVS